MLSDAIGSVHFVASLLALIFGTFVLFRSKGTQVHKIIGYLYCGSMMVVITTSFFMYNLHGTFGFFHWMAVISGASLLGGMLPLVFKWPKNYLGFHFSFMYWSVIGLYCALAAEIFTRIPLLLDFGTNKMKVFYVLAIVSSVLVGGVGSLYFRKLKKVWKKNYLSN